MKNTISKQILKELYDKETDLKTENGEKFDIPESGSLGLLALGHKGLIAWRKKKKEVKK